MSEATGRVTRSPHRILITLGYYLPGYKGGGPVRSVANLVQLLGKEFEFWILTADRDLGDKVHYPNVTPNHWQPVGKAHVMYLSPDRMTLAGWARQIGQVDHDLIYLNGFLSSQTRQTLLLKRMGKMARSPVVIAPRGEFSPGALGIKSFKKRIYTQTTLRLGLYDGLIWHATSNSEIVDIEAVLGRYIPDLAKRIMLAPNLVAPLSTDTMFKQNALKRGHTGRIVFLSRIARKKNLVFALNILRDIDMPVVFDIYGPKEDQHYWEECTQLIRNLPPNIQVTYRGSITPERVPDVLANYHLFFFPTLGENFGHAIVEAWAAGLPVLISDQTPWRNLKEQGIGWDIPLSEPARFKQVLRQVVEMDQAEISAWSKRAREFAAGLIDKQSHSALQQYRNLFQKAIHEQDNRTAEQERRGKRV